MPALWQLWDIFVTSFRHPYNKAGDGPEGPEVRTVAVKIDPVITGCKIVSVSDDGLLRNNVGVESLAPGMTIKKVSSYGKKVLIFLDELTIVISLGMSGRLCYEKSDSTHVIFTLQKDDSKFSLVFDDSRRFGSVRVVRDANWELRDLGPDLLQAALTTEISSEEWQKVFAKKMRSERKICDVLTDQNLVAGIGWYLMTEILYFCGISPLRKTKDVSLMEWELLRIIAHHIIKVSYSYGGFTLQSYISPDGVPGTYPAVIYGKSVDPLGQPIVKEKYSGSRSITYVPTLQK